MDDCLRDGEEITDVLGGQVVYGIGDEEDY